MYEYRKLGTGRPAIVCPDMDPGAWLFRILRDGVEIGHLWSPTLRIPGMVGYCSTEGYKGAFWHPDGTLRLAVLPGKSNPNRPRITQPNRPAMAAAVYKCYCQARLVEV